MTVTRHFRLRGWRRWFVCALVTLALFLFFFVACGEGEGEPAELPAAAARYELDSHSETSSKPVCS